MIIPWRPHRYRGGRGTAGAALVLGIYVGVISPSAITTPAVADLVVRIPSDDLVVLIPADPEVLV